MNGSVFESERLYFREVTPEDLDVLYDIYDDPVARTFLDPPMGERQQAPDVLKAYIDFYYAFYGFGYWIVCLRENGKPVGYCGFNVEEMDGKGSVELGYVVHRDFRRRGFAREMVAVALEYGYEELYFDKIGAAVHPDNAVSIALIRSSGFDFVKNVCRNGKALLFFLHDN